MESLIRMPMMGCGTPRRLPWKSASSCRPISGTSRTWRDVWREFRSWSDLRPQSQLFAFPRDVVDAIGTAQKFSGFLDRAAGWCASRSQFLKHWPPPATLQSQPATPWCRAPILGGLKYAVWRLPAFAASCHRARPPADRSADPMTRRQLR